MQRREVVLFPDLSVLWVIFFVLVLTILLDRLLLRPLQRVMHQREEATRSARALAERSAQEAREAAAEDAFGRGGTERFGVSRQAPSCFL